jgi:hypothetical protein
MPYFPLFCSPRTASGNVIASLVSMGGIPPISSSVTACKRRQAGSFLNEEFSSPMPSSF